jgi:hypothetical protein
MISFELPLVHVKVLNVLALGNEFILHVEFYIKFEDLVLFDAVLNIFINL